MKSDEIQRSLPRRLKDYNRNTDELRQKAMLRKNTDDPMNLMNKYLDKHREEMQDIDCSLSIKSERSIKMEVKKERDKNIDKKELKRQKKKLLKEMKRKRKESERKLRDNNDDRYSSDDSDYRNKKSRRSKKRKRKKHRDKRHKHKSSKKHKHSF